MRLLYSSRCAFHIPIINKLSKEEGKKQNGNEINSKCLTSHGPAGPEVATLRNIAEIPNSSLIIHPLPQTKNNFSLNIQNKKKHTYICIVETWGYQKENTS